MVESCLDLCYTIKTMKSDTPKTKPGTKRCLGKLLLLSLLLASLVLIANKSYLRHSNKTMFSHVCHSEQCEKSRSSGPMENLRFAQGDMRGILLECFRLLVRGHLNYARAQGYPTTMEELYARYEYPPPGENAADLYLEAFEYFVEWNEEDERLLPIFGDVHIPPGQCMDEPTLQLVSQFLDDNHDALILLHRAALFPQCRYPIESDDKIYSIDHYRGIRQSINLLALESLYYANTQRFDLAAQTLLDSFSLANSLKQEPLLTSWLTRTACDGFLNISILENIMNLDSLPKYYLTEIKKTLRNINYDYELKRAMAGGYAFDFKEELRSWEKTSYKLSKLDLLWYKISGRYERKQLVYFNKLQDCIEALEHPISYRIRIAASIKDWPNRLSDRVSIFQNIINSTVYVFIINAKYETVRRIVITALAVEQYRLDHNKLPVFLHRLVPEYLKSVIKDPYDGQDLRYNKLEKGYVVYSVGEDLTDNDGTKENTNGKPFAQGTDITFTVRR